MSYDIPLDSESTLGNISLKGTLLHAREFVVKCPRPRRHFGDVNIGLEIELEGFAAKIVVVDRVVDVNTRKF